MQRDSKILVNHPPSREATPLIRFGIAEGVTLIIGGLLYWDNVIEILQL